MIMGKSYQYKCKKCGYEKTFSVGVGFFTNDAWNQLHKTERKFRNEVFSGKYGEYRLTFVKKTAEIDIAALHKNIPRLLQYVLNVKKFQQN